MRITLNISKRCEGAEVQRDDFLIPAVPACHDDYAWRALAAKSRGNGLISLAHDLGRNLRPDVNAGVVEHHVWPCFFEFGQRSFNSIQVVVFIGKLEVGALSLWGIPIKRAQRHINVGNEVCEFRILP
jgi:hypothetical protein